MIATIVSIRLGERIKDRVGCVLTKRPVIEFHGDIKFSSDEWDMPGVWYIYRRDGFVLGCDTLRRFSPNDPSMRLKPVVYDRMIKTISDFLSAQLGAQLTEFIAQYDVMHMRYVEVVSGIANPHSLHGNREVRAEMKRLGIDPVVYTDHLDFSHVLNTPIVI